MIQETRLPIVLSGDTVEKQVPTQTPHRQVPRRPLDVFGPPRFAPLPGRREEAAFQAQFRLLSDQNAPLPERLLALRRVHNRYLSEGAIGFDPAVLRRALRETYIVDGGRLSAADLDWVGQAYRVDSRISDGRNPTRVDLVEQVTLGRRVSELRTLGDPGAVARAEFLLQTLR